MSADTGPDELAALIGNDDKYRVHVILELCDIKRRVQKLEDRPVTVSSSGDSLSNKFEGAGIALKALLGLIALLAAIGGFVIWVTHGVKP